MGISGFASQKRPLSFWFCGVCSFLSVAFGVLFVLLGIWAVHLRHRFTPIYTDVVCKMEPAKLEHFSLTDGLHLDLVTTTTCENPNPYSVEMRSTQAEKVYMGEDRTPVASITNIPVTTLPAKGKGSIEAKVTVKPTADMFSSLFSSFLGRDIPIYIENRMDMVVHIDFLIGDFSTKRAFNKDCGLKFHVSLFGGGAEMGPLVCGDDFDQLQIPPADHPVGSELHISAVSMAKDDIEKATEAKDVGLGCAMGLGFGLGLLLLLLGSCGLWRLCRRRPEGASAREVGDLANQSTNSTNKITPTQLGAADQNAPEEV